MPLQLEGKKTKKETFIHSFDTMTPVTSSLIHTLLFSGVPINQRFYKPKLLRNWENKQKKTVKNLKYSQVAFIALISASGNILKVFYYTGLSN